LTPTSSLSRDQKVLIIAPDPLLAALIGVVVERHRLWPVFPENDEGPDAALDREKPLSAIIVEATVSAAESELFIKRARKRGVCVFLFGSTLSVAPLRAAADGNGADVFGFPDDFDRFQEALGALANGPGRRNV
jgi:hypothetical protein